jgi:hypothetical protein
MQLRAPNRPLRQLGGLRVLRGVSRRVAEEARTRGFAAPALAGCAIIVGCARVRIAYDSVPMPSRAWVVPVISAVVG